MPARKKLGQMLPKPFNKELLSNCLLFLHQEEFKISGKDYFTFRSQLQFNKNIYAMMNNLTFDRYNGSKTILKINKKFKDCYTKEIQHSKDFIKKLQLIKNGDILRFPEAKKRYEAYQNGCKEAEENKKKEKALKNNVPVTGEVEVPAQQPIVSVKDILVEKKDFKNLKK